MGLFLPYVLGMVGVLGWLVVMRAVVLALLGRVVVPVLLVGVGLGK